MNRATPRMRDIAGRLIAFEARGIKSSGTRTPAACLVGEKLRPQLAAVMGNIGFSALQSRALALANGQFSWLRAVHVKADGGFQGLDAVDAQIDPGEFFEGCVVLFAHLLGLLVTFIGEELTLRMVREAWPELPLDGMDFVTGEK